MHEEPMELHYGRADVAYVFVKEWSWTIEPMISTGTWEIDTDFRRGGPHKTLDGGLLVNTNINL